MLDPGDKDSAVTFMQQELHQNDRAWNNSLSP